MIAVLVFITFFPAVVCNYFLKTRIKNLNRFNKYDGKSSDLAHILVLTAMIGYFLFYVYFLSSFLGKFLSLSIYLGCASLILRELLVKSNSFFIYLKNPHLWKPIFLLFLVVAVYLSIMHLVDLPINSRLLWKMPGDNIIPTIIAKSFFDGNPVTEVGATWLISDRPPLQAGLLLIGMPFWNFYDFFPFLGMIYQCFWLLGIWILAETLNLDKNATAFLFCFLIFSGFFLFNSTFTWPKLLAASYMTISFSYLIKLLREGEGKRYFLFMILLTLSLAYLSHGGIAFNLPAIGLVLLYISMKRKLLFDLVSMSLLPLVLIISWSVFQRSFAPPGNRLIKMHFAGVNDIDERSTVETIIDSYKGKSIDEILEVRKRNFSYLLHGKSLLNLDPRESRKGQFFHTFNALGVLNAGFFLTPLLLLGSRLNLRIYLTFLLVAVMSLGTWILLIYYPGGCVIHQGSYFTIILLYLISTLPLVRYTGVAIVFLFLQVLHFTYIWVFNVGAFRAASDGVLKIDIVALVFVIVGFCMILGHLFLRKLALPGSANK